MENQNFQNVLKKDDNLNVFFKDETVEIHYKTGFLHLSYCCPINETMFHYSSARWLELIYQVLFVHDLTM